ncbi:Methyltransferase-like protein 16 [Ataeniobius toweri]|uniref:Methyltransferase-like protein 16 n=1 Tax=Ataeniobius toweri TaxID=208326 RepID=A0ABU7AAV5_9TELE|nr:Methyltransferase-like protein 16 [Ataeniobius toweri]
MHPRNRYKDKPPDFAYLASKYPDFQQHVHTSLTGRPVVNFKEPEAVRALTCTLLKEDFGLTIEIPLERLIPTVPLRLNYIHWVEDLIDGQKQPRRGIDIGTGASCIYPLLGATMNGWYFLATEVDDICFDYAKKNVEQNNLSDLVKGECWLRHGVDGMMLLAPTQILWNCKSPAEDFTDGRLKRRDRNYL